MTVHNNKGSIQLPFDQQASLLERMLRDSGAIHDHHGWSWNSPESVQEYLMRLLDKYFDDQWVLQWFDYYDAYLSASHDPNMIDNDVFTSDNINNPVFLIKRGFIMDNNLQGCVVSFTSAMRRTPLVGNDYETLESLFDNLDAPVANLNAYMDDEQSSTLLECWKTVRNDTLTLRLLITVYGVLRIHEECDMMINDGIVNILW
jgi:hypothetical protein